MELNLGLLFVIVWLVAGFVGIRAFAARHLNDTTHANLVAAAVVLAFLAGWLLPGPRHATAPGATVATGAAAPAAVRGPRPNLAGTHVASGACKAGERPARDDGKGNVDAVLGASAEVSEGGTVAAADPVDVQGWATGMGPGELAAGLCFLVDGVVERRITVYYGVQRPDVATTFHEPNLIGSGYDARIVPGTLSLGPHKLQIAARSRGGPLVAIPTTRTVEVQ